MDRNFHEAGNVVDTAVALRKESVDRNTACRICGHHVIGVALRKESVDRNILSKSAMVNLLVALRKESVDRNTDFQFLSPPLQVALRKESVDRNSQSNIIKLIPGGRSPQGERG